MDARNSVIYDLILFVLYQRSDALDPVAVATVLDEHPEMKAALKNMDEACDPSLNGTEIFKDVNQYAGGTGGGYFEDLTIEEIRENLERLEATHPPRVVKHGDRFSLTPEGLREAEATAERLKNPLQRIVWKNHYMVLAKNHWMIDDDSEYVTAILVNAPNEDAACKKAEGLAKLHGMSLETNHDGSSVYRVARYTTKSKE